MILLALALGAAHAPQAAVGVDWRSVATLANRARLRGWRESWMAALRRARAAGKGAELTRGGALFDPDRATSRPVPPVGAYRCRTFKLGSQGGGMLDYVAYSPFACRIVLNGGAITFEKTGGSQRSVGRIYPQSDARAVFLCTMVLGDERRAIGYGRDPQRNLAGFVERVGPRRWRLVLPTPAFESLLDIVEITPR